MPIRRDRQESAERLAYRNRGDGRLVSKQTRSWQQLHWFTWCRLKRIDRNDAILASGDEGLGVGKAGARDLPNVEVLKQASRLSCVSGAAIVRDVVASYLSVVAEVEANAVVGVSPFQELVIGWEVEAERGSAE